MSHMRNLKSKRYLLAGWPKPPPVRDREVEDDYWSRPVEDLWYELDDEDKRAALERVRTLADRWEREAGRHVWAAESSGPSPHRRSIAMMRIFDAVYVALEELG